MGSIRNYVGLDLGTTKISVVIAEPDDAGNLKIVGVGVAPSRGMRRGNVVNLEETAQSIRRAVAEAERMSGCLVKSVYAGIAGDHIKSLNSRGVIAVSRRDAEIGSSDVERVVEAARAVVIPADREVFHVIPQEFIVDDQGGIRDPIGMAGVRLEADVHIVTGGMTSARNLTRAIEKAGLRVETLVLEPLASSYAVLAQDERELGVVLLDMGGGTSDLALFFEGSVRHTASIGLGGTNVTGDLAIGLRTSVDCAEEIKLSHGCALASMVSAQEMVEVPGVAGRPTREISRQLMASMIEPRMEEIFMLANKEVRKNHFAPLIGGGVVLTGGTSLLPGVAELAEQVFEMPVRLGLPRGLGGLSANVADPRFSTGVGLVMHAAGQDGRSGMFAESKPAGKQSRFDLIGWFASKF